MRKPEGLCAQYILNQRVLLKEYWKILNEYIFSLMPRHG
jgi:hypothetical protein